MRHFSKIMESIWPRCVDGKHMLAWLIKLIEPKNVLLVGASGPTTTAVMEVLPHGNRSALAHPKPPSLLTTINRIGEESPEVLPWVADQRLMRITNESRHLVRDSSIDFLFIGGANFNYDMIAAEWQWHAQKLVGGAIVCVDNLDFPGGGYRRFWDALPYDKVETKLGEYGFGMFLFERGK